MPSALHAQRLRTKFHAPNTTNYAPKLRWCETQSTQGGAVAASTRDLIRQNQQCNLSLDCIIWEWFFFRINITNYCERQLHVALSLCSDIKWLLITCNAPHCRPSLLGSIQMRSISGRSIARPRSHADTVRHAHCWRNTHCRALALLGFACTLRWRRLRPRASVYMGILRAARDVCICICVWSSDQASDQAIKCIARRVCARSWFADHSCQHTYARTTHFPEHTFVHDAHPCILARARGFPQDRILYIAGQSVGQRISWAYHIFCVLYQIPCALDCDKAGCVLRVLGLLLRLRPTFCLYALWYLSATCALPRGAQARFVSMLRAARTQHARIHFVRHRIE